MFAWIADNLATIIVGLIVLAVLVAAAVSLHRSNKSGGGCASCPSRGNCPHKNSCTNAVSNNNSH